MLPASMPTALLDPLQSRQGYHSSMWPSCLQSGCLVVLWHVRTHPHGSASGLRLPLCGSISTMGSPSGGSTSWQCMRPSPRSPSVRLALVWAPLWRRLSRASPAPPHLKRGSYEKPPSPPNPALKPSYSQIVKTKKPPRDPGAMARAPAMKGSRYQEVPGSIPTKDNYLARDLGNLSRASSRDPLLASAPRDQSHDLT